LVRGTPYSFYLPAPFHSRLKTHLYFPPCDFTLIPSGLTSRILTCTELKGHCLFVLVSGYVC